VKLTKQRKREREREPKKLTGRDDGQTNTFKKFRFRNKRISVLVVLVLLLQHPVLVLVFKQMLYLSFARWLGRLTNFLSCLSVAAA
jgi:hypothetical protein